LQEAEARIFLEQALEVGPAAPQFAGWVGNKKDETKALPAELAARINKVLEVRARASALLLSSNGGRTFDYCWQNWQDRSRMLFQTAAEVAKAMGQTGK